MPDKTELDGWLLAHDIFDLAGKGGYETLAPPHVPGTNPLWDEDPFDDGGLEDDPGLANVYWDGEHLQAIGEGEGDFTQIDPFLESVYYDPADNILMYWDGSAFVPIDFGDIWGDQVFLVFTTPPRAVEPGEESSPITIERRDIEDNPLSVGELTVYLYSSDPDLIFYFDGSEADTIVMEDGEESFTITFVTPNAGNPVISASTEVLG